MPRSFKEILFNDVLQKMPDALVITNQKGIIEVANGKVLNVFGYTPDELIGNRIEILVPSPLREKHKANVEGYFKDPTDKKMAAHRKVFGLRKDGTEFEIDITLASVILDKETYAIASVRNISDKKHLEEELQVENVSLQMANKELERYSYTITHDLKAPLIKIESLIEMLLHDIKEGKSPEQIDQLCKYLHETTASMKSMINRELEEAKNRITDDEEEVIHFSELFGELKKLIAIPGKFKVKIECDKLILTGKKIQFIQVFLNLLSNAIKFNNKKEGLIEIHCEEEEGEYKFAVTDNGMGIPADKLEDIFNLFEKGEDSKQSHGVGLYTVKSIIESRGGKISASSKVGEWTKFEFTWPKHIQS